MVPDPSRSVMCVLLQLIGPCWYCRLVFVFVFVFAFVFAFAFAFNAVTAHRDGTKNKLAAAV